MITIADDNYLIFLGMDPALRGDYFGVCAHVLDLNNWGKKRTGALPLPYLAKLGKLHAQKYTDIWRALNTGLFQKFSNFYKLQIDYTNEKTLADFLAEKYGESRITKTPFTKGESGTKMRIAQSSLSFLQSGYTFPDHTKIRDPVDADNIRTLKEQIVKEEIVINPDGSIKFRHKGPHNDLLHAWMLSLDECMVYVLDKLGRQGTHVVGGIKNRIITTEPRPITSKDTEVLDWLSTGGW